MALLLLWPVFLVIAAVIAIQDGRPVFFGQERIGARGVSFRMWKFRTMVVGAERRGLLLTVGKDSRVTRVGHWLRRTKLDELPQLFNVLRGDMAFVGPRPEVPRYVSTYSESQRAVLALMPGITDPASLSFFEESALLANASDPERVYVEQILPEKIRLNLDYAAGSSVWTDLGIIGSTFARVFSASLQRRGLKRAVDSTATS